MTMYVMKLHEAAGGIGATVLTGKLLKDADFEALGGRGVISGTDDLKEARMFETPQSAMEFYFTQSKTVPLRDDGRPNRPLSCYTVEILPVTVEWTGPKQ